MTGNQTRFAAEIAVNFDLELAVDVLRRTPPTLHAVLAGISNLWANGTEGPETFSPFDVVGDLIDGEETDWIPRARIVAHDLGHVAQIARVMAKQYRDEVGPWLAFLPVLTDRPTPRS